MHVRIFLTASLTMGSHKKKKTLVMEHQHSFVDFQQHFAMQSIIQLCKTVTDGLHSSLSRNSVQCIPRVLKHFAVRLCLKHS